MPRKARVEFAGAAYDAANRLVLASNSGMAASPEVELVYDGLGRCVKRTIQGVATIIIYDEWKPIAEWDGWTEEYFQAWNVYGPGADEILLRHRVKVGYIRFHADANGNVAFLLDNDGAVVEKYTYDVFGRPKITDRYGNPRASSHYDNRFLFQGREYIGEVGVYDYRHRFYHPSLGRFLQKDPTGFDAGDMNLFRYCGDDPVDGSDPDGLQDSRWATLMWWQSGSKKSLDETLNDLQDLNSGGTRRDISRSQLEKEMSPSAPLSKAVKGDLDRGCIGLTAAYQGLRQTFPDDAPGTKAYLSETEARARGVDKGRRNFVFAKQGHWRNGRPLPDKQTGEVPLKSISNKMGNYNYVTTFPGTNSYAWMNSYASWYRSQQATIAPAPARDPHHPHTVWYSTPIPD